MNIIRLQTSLKRLLFAASFVSSLALFAAPLMSEAGSNCDDAFTVGAIAAVAEPSSSSAVRDYALPSNTFEMIPFHFTDHAFESAGRDFAQFARARVEFAYQSINKVGPLDAIGGKPAPVDIRLRNRVLYNIKKLAWPSGRSYPEIVNGEFNIVHEAAPLNTPATPHSVRFRKALLQAFWDSRPQFEGEFVSGFSRPQSVSPQAVAVFMDWSSRIQGLQVYPTNNDHALLKNFIIDRIAGSEQLKSEMLGLAKQLLFVSRSRAFRFLSYSEQAALVLGIAHNGARRHLIDVATILERPVRSEPALRQLAQNSIQHFIRSGRWLVFARGRDPVRDRERARLDPAILIQLSQVSSLK